MAYTLDRRLFLTADKERVVEEGDAQAAFLLGSAGKEIPDEEAERLGLTKKTRTKAADEEVKQAAAAPNKARKAASSK